MVIYREVVNVFIPHTISFQNHSILSAFNQINKPIPNSEFLSGFTVEDEDYCFKN